MKRDEAAIECRRTAVALVLASIRDDDGAMLALARGSVDPVGVQVSLAALGATLAQVLAPYVGMSAETAFTRLAAHVSQDEPGPSTSS